MVRTTFSTVAAVDAVNLLVRADVGRAIGFPRALAIHGARRLATGNAARKLSARHGILSFAVAESVAGAYRGKIRARARGFFANLIGAVLGTAALTITGSTTTARLAAGNLTIIVRITAINCRRARSVLLACESLDTGLASAFACRLAAHLVAAVAGIAFLAARAGFALLLQLTGIRFAAGPIAALRPAALRGAGSAFGLAALRAATRARVATAVARQTCCARSVPFELTL